MDEFQKLKVLGMGVSESPVIQNKLIPFIYTRGFGRVLTHYLLFWSEEVGVVILIKFKHTEGILGYRLPCWELQFAGCVPSMAEDISVVDI